MIIVLSLNNKIFELNMIALAKSKIMLIHSFYKVKFALLISTTILAMYFNFYKIFYLNFVAKQTKYNEIDNYFINFFIDKELLYSPI